MRRTLSTVIAAGALVLLVGCGGQKPQAQSTSQGGGGGQSSISIEATEFAFTPNKITTTAGTRTFEVRNKGTIEHDLTIDAVNLKITVGPGSSGTGSADLKPGTYEFYCSIPGHKEAGMTGTLTVS